MALRPYIFCLGLSLAQAVLPQYSPANSAGLQEATPVEQGSGQRNNDRHPVTSPDYYCHLDNLATSWAFDTSPAIIARHEVYYVQTGHASVSFQFRNVAPLKLEAVALILEYLDSQGQVIDEVPVAGVSRTAAGRFRAPFPVEPTWVYLKGSQEAEHWESALAPGQSVLLAGSKDGTRTGNCPATAKVTFLRLQFANGTARTYSSAGWHLGPRPRRVPEVPTTFRPAPVTRPCALLARIKINASGDVVDLIPEGQNTAPDVLRWTRDLMMQEWKFHAALLQGKAVDSQLTVLFRFPLDATSPFPEVEPIPFPVTLIQFFRKHDLEPNNYTGSDLVVTYGQMQEGSVLE